MYTYNTMSMEECCPQCRHPFADSELIFCRYSMSRRFKILFFRCAYCPQIIKKTIPVDTQIQF